MAQRNLNEKKTKLRIILDTKRIMQKDLAKKADVEIYQISEICSGKRTGNIMLSTAKRIVKVLGVTLDEAFGDDEELLVDENNNNNNSINQNQGTKDVQ